MTKRRLTPNAEVAKHVTAAMQNRTETQRRTEEKEAVVDLGIVFPDHLVVAHANYLTGKWFRWRLIEGDRQLAIADLTRRYRSRRKAEL